MSYKSKYADADEGEYEKKDEEIIEKRNEIEEEREKILEEEKQKKEKGIQNGYSSRKYQPQVNGSPDIRSNGPRGYNKKHISKSYENVEDKKEIKKEIKKEEPKEVVKETPKETRKEVKKEVKKEEVVEEKKEIQKKIVKSEDLKQFRQENQEALANSFDQLTYIQEQIKETEKLLKLLKEEEKRLKGLVVEGSPTSKDDENVIIDVMCVLPNGKQIWINIKKDDDPIVISKNLANEYLLSKDNEQKLLSYIIEAQKQ